MPLTVNHAILHIFDFVSCQNSFARQEIDLADKTARNFVLRHASKALGSIESRRGDFAPDSLFAAELEAYFRNERDFVSLSQAIGDYLLGQLGKMERTPSTDLLVLDFDGDPKDDFDGINPRYIGVFLLDSKEAYTHSIRSDGSNAVQRNFSVLPSPSQKIQSYAIVNLRDMSVLFADKPRKIAGQDMLLIPDGLLQCSIGASGKQTLDALQDAVRDVADEFGVNSAVAMSRAKAFVAQTAQVLGSSKPRSSGPDLADPYADEDPFGDAGSQDEQPYVPVPEDFDLADFAAEAFDSNETLVERFEEVAHSRELPQRVPLQRAAAKRLSRTHRIVTNTGIVISFPAEYSRSSEYIKFSNNADGSYSIELNNIQSFENR